MSQPADTKPSRTAPIRFSSMEPEETDAILAPPLERGRALVYSAEEWLSLEFGKCEAIIGTPEQATVRPLTKNLIEAPEKSFKTSFLLRLLLGLSCGETVFSVLPVTRPYRVLYLHGELSPPELKERIGSAIVGLPRPLDNFFQGRDLRLDLIDPVGQQALRGLVQNYKPEVLALDAWQSFITGFDENAFKDVSVATHFLDQLIEDFQLTVFLVTHKGKDHRRGTRGHSLLAGWRDTLFKLNRSGINPLVTVEVEPRWASPVTPFNLKFEDETVWESDDECLTPQARRIRELVDDSGGECTEEELRIVVRKEMSKKPEAARKAIKRAAEDGAISLERGVVRVKRRGALAGKFVRPDNGQPS